MEGLILLIVTGVSVVFSSLILVFVLVAKRMIEEVYIHWLHGPYEKSLYLAIAEVHRTEVHSEAFGDWISNWPLLSAWPLRWSGRIRKCVEAVHEAKSRKFRGAVGINADLRYPNRLPGLKLLPWKIWVLGKDGVVEKTFTMSRLEALDLENHLKIFFGNKEASRIQIRNHKQDLVRTVARPEMDSALAEGERSILTE